MNIIRPLSKRECVFLPAELCRRRMGRWLQNGAILYCGPNVHHAFIHRGETM